MLQKEHAKFDSVMLTKFKIIIKSVKYINNEDYENTDESVFLSSNHTRFILVDDGSDGQFDVEIELRNRLETELRKGLLGRSIPFVLIVVQG
jgi:hypothetical protein